MTTTTTSTTEESTTTTTEATTTTSTTEESTTTTTTSTTESTTTTTAPTTTTTTVPPFTGPIVPTMSGDPINGGTLSFNITGGSAGAAGGATVNFTAFTPSTGWSKLYWGPSSGALPTAGLDATQHSLPFSGITGGGTIATWEGTTSWTNPDTGTTHTGVPIQVKVTITIGGLLWAPSSSLPALDPGPGSGIGAAVNVLNPSPTPFSAKVEFLANIPDVPDAGFIAINSVRNGGGKTLSPWTGAFYTATP